MLGYGSGRAPGSMVTTRTRRSPRKLRISIRVPSSSMLALMGKCAYTSRILYSNPYMTPFIRFCAVDKRGCQTSTVAARHARLCVRHSSALLMPSLNSNSAIPLPLTLPVSFVRHWEGDGHIRCMAHRHASTCISAGVLGHRLLTTLLT